MVAAAEKADGAGGRAETGNNCLPPTRTKRGRMEFSMIEKDHPVLLDLQPQASGRFELIRPDENEKPAGGSIPAQFDRSDVVYGKKTPSYPDIIRSTITGLVKAVRRTITRSYAAFQGVGTNYRPVSIRESSGFSSERSMSKRGRGLRRRGGGAGCGNGRGRGGCGRGMNGRRM